MIEQYSNVLVGLYSTINAPENIEQAYDRIAEYGDAMGVMQIRHSADGFGFNRAFKSRIYDPMWDAFEKYTEVYGHYEHRTRSKIPNAPRFQPVTDIDAWPEEPNVFEREDFLYVRREMGILRRIAFNLTPSVGWRHTVVFHYPEPVFELPVGALEKASKLVPHIGKLAELSDFLLGLQEKYQAVLSVLDNLNIGICLLDSAGNIVLANACADSIFAQKDGIGKVQGRLNFASASDNASFRQRTLDIAQTANGENDLRSDAFYAERPSGKSPYYVELSPMRDGRYEIIRDFTGSIAYIIDTDNPPQIDLSPLAIMAGFTPVEVHTARLMCEGYIDREIADIRNVGLETTRKQIKTVLAKANVKSRLQFLIKAVSIKPAIL